MRTIQSTALGLLLLSATVGWAAPGKLERPLCEPGVVLRPSGPRAAAPLAMHAGPQTMQLASPAIAAANAEAAVVAPPRFVRDDPMREAWRVQLEGRLQRASVAGNVIFVVFDLGSPGAVEDHRYVALYQMKTPEMSRVSADVTLLLREGFEAQHSYRMRIAQLFGGKEVILGETDFALE